MNRQTRGASPETTHYEDTLQGDNVKNLQDTIIKSKEIAETTSNLSGDKMYQGPSKDTGSANVTSGNEQVKDELDQGAVGGAYGGTDQGSTLAQFLQLEVSVILYN